MIYTENSEDSMLCSWFSLLNDGLELKVVKNNQQMENKKNLREENRVLKSSHDHNKIYHQ